MSCSPSLTLSSVSTPIGPRKRTSSFSTPNPNKAKSHRMLPMPPSSSSSLRRTSSYITLPDILPSSTVVDNTPSSSSPTPSTSTSTSSECSALVLRHYKEQRQRQRRRSQINHSSPSSSGPHFTIGPAPSNSSSSSLPLPAPQPISSRKLPPAHISISTTLNTPTTPPRATSPLSPTQKLLPPRASFPRSKPTPNLYKIAITARMRCSPEGQKILSMGPRLAVSILTATRELENIVAAQTQMGGGYAGGEGDGDVAMVDGTTTGLGVTLSKSWIVVPGGEDWEMVDCSS